MSLAKEQGLIPQLRSYYSPRIFKSVGLTGSSTSLYATGIYGVVRLVCVIVAMYYVVDRFGRRKMLMGGAAVMLIAMVSGQISHLRGALTDDHYSGSSEHISKSLVRAKIVN